MARLCDRRRRAVTLTLMPDSSPTLHPLLAEALQRRKRVWGERNADVLRAMRGERVFHPGGGLAGSLSLDGWRSLGDGARYRVPPASPEAAAA